jgi:hypothetical protein
MERVGRNKIALVLSFPDGGGGNKIVPVLSFPDGGGENKIAPLYNSNTHRPTTHRTHSRQGDESSAVTAGDVGSLTCGPGPTCQPPVVTTEDLAASSVFWHTHTCGGGGGLGGCAAALQ